MVKARELIFKEFPDKKLEVYYRNAYDYGTYDAGNEYEFESFGIRKGDTVIDVGAYTGGELMWFIARNRPLKYFCIEPIPENIDVISKNIEANESKLRIVLLQVAIGAENKQIKMYYGNKDTDWGRTYYFRGNIKSPFRGTEYVEVRMTTLDRLFEENGINRCKLLRMEPEGTDLEILGATSENTLKKIDWIAGAIDPHEGLVEATGGLFELVDNTKSGIYRLKRR